jgi:hypothetical protein
MNTTKYALMVTLVLSGLWAPNVVRADGTDGGYTYTYTGSQFTTFVGGLSCPTVCSVDGSFTVRDPLLAGTTNFVSPASFDFFISTAGAPSLTNTNGVFVVNDGFIVTTDASDNIINWAIELEKDSVPGGIIALCTPPSCSVIFGGPSGGDLWEPIGGVTPPAYATSNARGSWSPPSHSVPEPSTLVTLGMGLLGLAVARRRLLPA